MLSLNNEFEITTDIAKKVILTMGQWKVSLTPENYQVWFEYCIGGNEEIVTDINELITSGKPFIKGVNENLYDKHFGKHKAEKVVAEMHHQMQKILKSVLEEIFHQNASAVQYSNKLREYSDRLKDAREMSEITHVIKDIIKDTNKMEESSHSLQKRLENVTSEARNLKQTLERKEREASIDVLTDLHNRKALDKKIEDLYNEFTHQGSLFSVLMIDIDFFKKFNDTYGHKIGDEVLQIVGATLKECIKGKDFPARYGGEEFIVLLPMTSHNNASTVAEQIRQEISKKTFKLKKTGETIGQVTVSIGVSEIKSDDTIDSVVERADRSLYLAKGSGRNGVKTERDLL